MKKLLIFCESYVAGGSDKIARILTDNLNSDKVFLLINKKSNKKIFESDSLPKNVTIITYNLITITDLANYSIKFVNIKIIFYLLKIFNLLIRYPLFLFSIFYFYFLFKKLEIDVFISNNGGYPGGEYNRSSTIAASLIKKCKVYHIFHSMALPYRKLFKGIESKIDNIIDNRSVLITDSIISANQMKNSRNIKQNIEVIYNGVGNNKQKNYNDSYELKLLHVGTLDSNKNQIMLLKAINLLVNKHNCKITVKLIGKEAEQGYLKLLKEYTKNSNLEQHVDFVGFSSDPYSFYNACDLLIVTSFIESFPTVILEAMSVGMPVITTNAGGVKEQVIDNVTGYIIDVNDFNTLADKIMFFYKNKSQIKKFGFKSFEQFNKNFKLEKMIENYNKLLEKGSK